MVLGGVGVEAAVVPVRRRPSAARRAARVPAAAESRWRVRRGDADLYAIDGACSMAWVSVPHRSTESSWPWCSTTASDRREMTLKNWVPTRWLISTQPRRRGHGVGRVHGRHEHDVAPAAELDGGGHDAGPEHDEAATHSNLL